MSRYETHNLQDRDLPFICKEHVVRSKGGMFGASNWHENVEIVHIVSGSGAVSINGRVFEVEPGDLVVINTNQLHSFAACEGEMKHRYLIVDRAFCLANGIDTNALAFTSRFTDPRVSELMEQLYAAYTIPNGGKLRTLTIRTRVLELMLLLCSEYATATEPSGEIAHTVTYVKQAIDYVRASYDKDFSLDDVAAFVGVSRCYLSREFHKYTGYPFVAYVNRTRCMIAQQLLADDRLSISEVGRRCGFSNRSYFAKCFCRYVGMLPAEYRAVNC